MSPFSIFVVWMAVVPVLLHSQPKSEVEHDFQLRTEADLVVLDVGVENRAHAVVKGLKREDFQVFENGKIQNIKQFGNEDLPVTVGLVVDASGSMQAKQREVVAAAVSFIRASNPKDEIFVVKFNDRARLAPLKGALFSDDVGLLEAALENGAPRGRTALYDAMTLALEHLSKGKWERKALLLISDGGDNQSRNSLLQVVNAIQQSPVTVYAIGLFEASDPDRNPGVLRRLADSSGGSSFFPEELSEIDALCRGIAADIRSRYTLAYTPPSGDRRDALRKLKVTAVAPSGEKLRVHTRPSYALSKLSE